jgi:hypothetical protein
MDQTNVELAGHGPILKQSVERAVANSSSELIDVLAKAIGEEVMEALVTFMIGAHPTGLSRKQK